MGNKKCFFVLVLLYGLAVCYAAKSRGGVGGRGEKERLSRNVLYLSEPCRFLLLRSKKLILLGFEIA